LWRFIGFSFPAWRLPAFIAGQAIETIMAGGGGERIRGLRKGFPYFALFRTPAFLLDACLFLLLAVP
jgi:hypothetical protein